MKNLAVTGEMLRACMQRAKRSAKVVAAAAISVGLLSAAAVPAYAAAQLKVHYYPNVFVMLPIWVAQEKGFFAANDIEAELFDMSNGTVAMTALASGSIDILQMPPNYTVVYNNKNPEQRVTQISALYGAPIYSLLGLKDVVAACADAKKAYPAPLNCLKGQRVGVVALGSDNYQVVRSLLAQVGLTENDVNITPTGGTVGTVNMIKSNQIDYGIMAEPGSSLAKESGLVDPLVDIASDPLMKPWTGNASFASTALLKKDPAKFQAYARAIDEAATFIRDEKNLDETQAILLKYMKVEPAIASVMLRANFGTFTAQNDCQALDNQAKWLAGTGQLPEGSAPKCDDFFLAGAN